jgi:hypothetical protein
MMKTTPMETFFSAQRLKLKLYYPITTCEGRYKMKTKLMIRVMAVGLTISGIGCATAGRPQVYAEAEMEVAQQRAEAETLARLATSNNNDIADAASTLSRERVTR